LKAKKKKKCPTWHSECEWCQPLGNNNTISETKCDEKVNSIVQGRRRHQQQHKIDP